MIYGLGVSETYCSSIPVMLPHGPESFVFQFAIQKYSTVTLPGVVYRCQTWSVILREKHRLRVFENRVLRKIFGPKWKN
jgi:hypothetical protein